jgi:hypothetical protein
MSVLQAAAPGHVAEVCARVFDHLDQMQMTQWHAICETLLVALDAP